MSSTQRFPTQQLKQLRADLTLIATTLKNLTTSVQLLSDTLSGVSVSNATTLNPTFNTVTAGDLYYLDNNGVATSVETTLSNKADTTTLSTNYVSKSYPTFSGTLNIGVNSINFTNTSNNTHTIDRTILESLYNNYSLWKTSFPTVDLSPYVTATSLSSTLGSYVLSTTLSNYITSSSLTTTLRTYVTSSSLTTALGSYVTSSSLTTTLGSYITSSSLTTTLGSYVTNSGLTTTLGGYALTTALGGYMPLSGGTFTGDIALGTHSLKFTNANAVPRTINQAMLETLYNGSSTWLSVTPTSLPATTFTGDITCNTQIVLKTSTLTLPILEYVISSLQQLDGWVDTCYPESHHFHWRYHHVCSLIRPGYHHQFEIHQHQ